MQEQSDLTLSASSSSSDKHNQLSRRFKPKQQIPPLELNRLTLPNQKTNKALKTEGKRQSFPVTWKCMEIFYHLFYLHV